MTMKKNILLLLLYPTLLSAQLLTRVTDSNNPAVNFVNTPASYKGVTWIDMDQDNWPDLFVNQHFVFKNLRNGNFMKMPDYAGSSVGQIAAGSSWGDVDNDGLPDVISASLVSGYYLNKGNFTFAKGPDLPGFGAYPGWDCAMVDANSDGRLDLLFVHACCTFHPTAPTSGRFYLQKSDGQFERISGYTFTDSLAPFTIPIWSDYDLDGDMDLFIGSGPASGNPIQDHCYKNLLKESGQFKLERLNSFPFNQLQDGQTYNFVDYDLDGDLDICLTNYIVAPTRVYRNDGSTYTQISTSFTTAQTQLSNVWGDMDNDGDQDVVFTFDGSPFLRISEVEDGVFGPIQEVGQASSKMSGVALADYDNDGDLDVYTNGANAGRALFKNNTSSNTTNNWAIFSLEGTKSNRSAIGAWVRLKANIKGKAYWQMRQVLAHNSFQSQSDIRQHFGLGDATQIDSLEVIWPSGAVQKFANLAKNNFYKIIENQGVALNIQDVEQASVDIKPNPFSRDFQVSATKKIQGMQMFDSTGKILAITTQIQDNSAEVRVLGNPPTASYFLQIFFEDGRSTLKQVMKW